MTSAAAKNVDARKPAIYLVVGAVLALGSMLLGGLASGEPTGPAQAPQAGGAPTAPAPACTEAVRESLRPQGPLPAPGAMPAGSTMAVIADRGRLIAGVDQGKFLAGYRDPLTGNLSGSDIDIVRRIAAAIFGDPERVQYVVLNIADRAAALERDQVDVVVNSFTVTCARQRVVEFSAPYMPASQRLLVPVDSGIREVEDLAGRTVCTSRGSTTEIVLRNLGLQVESLTGIPDCVLELQRGRVAAVSSDDVILAGLAAQDPNTRVVGRALDTSRYAVGMRPDEPDLVRFVNGVLEAARADGSLAASNRHWYTGRLDPVPPPPPPVYRD
ncbi:amino acid ABC transporter substrate-binding protein (PAAT family) [Pseudonocardia hierapolitana]|uniref:Amino acid ABC transporter substrate-binding protein (PAAT family) n=1 Tax=Pseudonocardia hierapolitana TaxID=1128676 RepID=A0A561T2D8_9PSEU|nr:glutamate ABC transporter substrate-binding protein [Pseudonocardia hierapolitana]TWF81255.1 amino acid ABC transporter substrate-binding protein (PAAT family) [Pseudonocardia hierapolitana]